MNTEEKTIYDKSGTNDGDHEYSGGLGTDSDRSLYVSAPSTDSGEPTSPRSIDMDDASIDVPELDLFRRAAHCPEVIKHRAVEFLKSRVRLLKPNLVRPRCAEFLNSLVTFARMYLDLHGSHIDVGEIIRAFYEHHFDGAVDYRWLEIVLRELLH